MKVCIDAGHGGYDSGAVGQFSKEKDINLAVSLLTKQELEKAGFVVVLTRDKDIFVNLRPRCIIANENKADIFVSIHTNASTNQTARGFEVFCYKITNNNTTTKAGRLATLISQSFALNVRGITNNRGVKEARFFVLRYTLMPAVLVECGFITNPVEERVLNQKETQIEIAKAISIGIQKYFKGG